ncbi:hypothetical protein ZIOFF_012754 [Zingiber officinale]|uniref:Flavin-containing monooxygenase n=1 Tax=Zingiber officinale TaxID=94328 RepID=A0A8J5IAG7_ZINOF|nr:hypothetical protein ZIOFF_012754 [Zingiber officinale]
MPRVRTVCTTVGGRCKWIVRSRERRTDDGEFVEEIFEAVVVATGNFSLPRLPKIRSKVFTKLFLLDFAAVLASLLCSSGMEEWKRKQFHSHVYKVPHPFQHEEVVVVGGAISGPEIAQVLLHVTKEVHKRLNNGNPILNLHLANLRNKICSLKAKPEEEQKD